LTTLLPVNQEIPQNAKSVQFKIETINGSKIKNLYESGNQKVSRVSESSSLVEVRNVNFRESKSAYSNMREQKFIKPNTMIDSNDPVIQTLARNAARGSKNIYDVANKLSKFSYNFIKNKNFRVGFATATEVARNNEGDCTEHAVFLAALGRSMGIPSRVATGLVFMKNFKDQENVLGFHMWTEFFLKGRWCTFDSALNKSGAQTDRITLSTSSLSEDTINEIGLEIYEFLSNLNVKVQKIDFN
jgi:transglutaminase-like putative cysteine protease